MPLPHSNIYWKDYEIDTPTFDLLPVEKPDMSPFLVHMTGRNQILSILRGENIPEGIMLTIPTNNGYLQSNIPEYGTQTGYNASVVCFTETPTFALDFFRYRSFRRWQDDQRYGIGFSKSNLVNRGVRPVLYLDNTALTALNRIKDEIGEQVVELEIDGLRRNARQLINSIYPITYPLLENTPDQGFMWEREWRYPQSQGFVFPFDNIRIICCPEDEETQIREIIGGFSENISFIRSWIEYDDVTNFISRQESVWNGDIPQPNENDNLYNHRAALELTKNMLAGCKNSLHSIESYEEFIEGLDVEKERINEQRNNLNTRIEQLNAAVIRIQGIINRNERR
ncbi:MAG: abortive infection system antitoxin AbiGi family protein [Melioribacteraceae bacterium]|nr:abortive infection system antitoxin AbiGi family protein [Melioribacteraceae bacterium]